jgi:hypothetical protein
LKAAALLLSSIRVHPGPIHKPHVTAFSGCDSMQTRTVPVRMPPAAAAADRDIANCLPVPRAGPSAAVRIIMMIGISFRVRLPVARACFNIEFKLAAACAVAAPLLQCKSLPAASFRLVA